MRSHGKPVLNRLWSKNLLISLPWSLVGVEENVLALHEKRLISIYTTNSTMANTANYNPNWTKQYLKSRKEEGKTVGYFQIWCKVARVYSKYKSQILSFSACCFFLASLSYIEEWTSPKDIYYWLTPFYHQNPGGKGQSDLEQDNHKTNSQE